MTDSPGCPPEPLGEMHCAGVAARYDTPPFVLYNHCQAYGGVPELGRTIDRVVACPWYTIVDEAEGRYVAVGAGEEDEFEFPAEDAEARSAAAEANAADPIMTTDTTMANPMARRTRNGVSGLILHLESSENETSGRVLDARIRGPRRSPHNPRQSC